jgi:hypothetical protein
MPKDLGNIKEESILPDKVGQSGASPHSYGDKDLEFLKFCEDTANQIKGRAQQMTVWLIGLSAAVMAFCFQFCAEQASRLSFEAFATVEAALCTVGIALCAVLMWILWNMKTHMVAWWTRADLIKAIHPEWPLPMDEEKRKKIMKSKAEYKAKTSTFVKALLLFPPLFMLGHIGLMIFMLTCAQELFKTQP